MADRRNSGNEHAWVEERLSAYINDQLEARERAQLERHLRDCARCQASLASLRWTISLVKQAPAPALPRQFTLPLPAPRTQPRGMPAFGFGFARLATVVATLLLFAVVGLDVISQLGGGYGASAPAPVALQNAAQPTSVALAPEQAEDQSKRLTPTAAAPQATLLARPPAPAVPPPASATETLKGSATTAAAPKGPAQRASATPTTSALAGAASVPPTVAPTARPQATAPPPTATAPPSPTPAAQALAQPTGAPLPPRPEVERPQPVVTPVRATEIGLSFVAIFFGIVTVLLGRRK